jgi:hypothetical protein
MTENHSFSITPPPSELVLQWIGEFFGCTAGGELSDSERFLTARAAQWGADQELEACLAEVARLNGQALADRVRAARRPKPPSLKEQSIALIDRIQAAKEAWDISELETIRRALEQLPDHE